jgi:diguanylate cyclase (GGDEF)-like protein
VTSRLSRWFRSHWQDAGVTPDVRAYFRQQQTLTLARSLVVTEPANFVISWIMVELLRTQISLTVLLTWAAVMSVLTLTALAHTVKVLRTPDRKNKTYRTSVTYRAVTVAIVEAGFCLYALNQVDSKTQVVIVALFLGVMGGGVIALSSHPPAGVAWTILMGAIGATGLVLVGGKAYVVLAILLIALCVVSLSWQLQQSKIFLARMHEKIAADEQREITDLLLRDFEGSARDWLWETDNAGKLRRISMRLSESLQRSASDMKSIPLPQLLRQSFGALVPEAKDAINMFEHKLTMPVTFREHLVPVTVAGELRWWSMSARPLYDVAGQWVGWRGVGSDTTDSARREQDLVRLANVDSLTGLASRHQFQSAMRAFDISDPEIETGVLLIDLDNFKGVNDTLGHAVGDLLLQQVAQRLAAKVREDDLLARLGGDEYALIVRNAPGMLNLATRGRELIDALAEPFAVGGALMEVRGSVGIACAPTDAADAEALMRAADVALYAAKDAGRNCVVLFNSELAQRSQERSQMMHDLAQAVDEKQLTLQYQPQVHARSGALIGFEALIRWNRPGHGMVSPADFIPLAEETGLILNIGVWVLSEACKEAMTWPGHLRIAVNLSASQFASRNLLDEVRQALQATGLPAQRLELEITESALIEDRIAAAETLRALRALGVRVAIDDFGTGYSSLSYLGTFALDHLKIDRSFIVALEADSNGRALTILNTILQLARSLGLATVAEGVETNAQIQILRQQGCDAFQGFCIARPMAADKIAAFIGKWNEKLDRAAVSVAVAAD